MKVVAAPLQEAIEVNGSTVANEEVTISSEVPGKITKVLFTEGAWVEKGTPLVQLDVDELNAQKSARSYSKTSMKKLQNGSRAYTKKKGLVCRNMR